MVFQMSQVIRHEELESARLVGSDRAGRRQVSGLMFRISEAIIRL